jgi:hypothetical protein
VDARTKRQGRWLRFSEDEPLRLPRQECRTFGRRCFLLRHGWYRCRTFASLWQRIVFSSEIFHRRVHPSVYTFLSHLRVALLIHSVDKL